ncbi:hypothetical protein [Marinicrinis lubricantis]|uniref:General stress protein 17M-like domain-containing protein n=1 Tax=Marinicrinis lubricantis TaxID=2086470 RepID=A0ABW1IUW7_9BACL
MAEKHITAYFKDKDSAEGVATSLHTLRVRNITVERMEDNDRYEGGRPYAAAMLGGVQGSSPMNFGAFGTQTMVASTPIIMDRDDRESYKNQVQDDKDNDQQVMLTFVVDEADAAKSVELIHEARGRLL